MAEVGSYPRPDILELCPHVGLQVLMILVIPHNPHQIFIKSFNICEMKYSGIQKMQNLHVRTHSMGATTYACTCYTGCFSRASFDSLCICSERPSRHAAELFEKCPRWSFSFASASMCRAKQYLSDSLPCSLIPLYRSESNR